MKGNVCQNKYFLCRTLANLHLRKEKKNKQWSLPEEIDKGNSNA
jgi:hypothetical protein